ncbi:MAG: hypothetical protein ACREYD_07210 [Casimicrobiaceae bacterium]
MNFRYSYSEVSAHGGKARLKSRKTRFEDGKLRSEAFEGELDRTTYEQTMAGAQRYFAAHAALLTRSLSLFLPFPGKQDSDRD